jgi:hypothetical protein
MLVSAEGMAFDFLPADQVFPICVENGEVVSCAFLGQNGTVLDENGEPLTLLSVHERVENGRWCVTNYAFDESFLPTVLPQGVTEQFYTDRPLFAILTPNSSPTVSHNASIIPSPSLRQSPHPGHRWM